MYITPPFAEEVLLANIVSLAVNVPALFTTEPFVPVNTDLEITIFQSSSSEPIPLSDKLCPASTVNPP